MIEGYMQLGVGGGIAFLIIKEVLRFLRGRSKNTGSGCTIDVINENKCLERRDVCSKSMSQNFELLSVKVEGQFNEIKTSLDTMGTIQLKQQERLEKGDETFQGLCVEIQHLQDLVEAGNSTSYGKRKSDKKKQK